MKQYIRMLTCLFWLGFIGMVSAQTRTITGNVTDDQGVPLPGATIAGENYRLLFYRPKEDAFPEMGYFIIVSDGSDYRLFLKRKKVFMDAVEARTGLERSFPVRFVDQVNYYYQIGDGTLLPFKRNKSGLREVFRGKESALKIYLKLKS